MLSGRYQLGERLGQGGMAEVFEAEDVRLGRPVAIKMLRAHLAAEQIVKSRFELEARTAARLSHPNVVGIFDTAEDDGVAYIVMERLPGTTLADELGRGPVSAERTREIATQVLSALQAAHEVGIVHRDIKPANILTCPDGRVKVADFGIATAMDEATGITMTGLLVGTPAYLAPERLDGSPATASSDLYSLGALLYVALAGRPLFEARNTLGLMAAIRDEEPEPLSKLRPDIDPALCRLVERAMAKDPAARFSSASEMAALLEKEPDDTAELELRTDATQVMEASARGATVVMARAETASHPPQGSSSLSVLALPRKARLVEAARRHRVPLVFLGAALLALVIALPLSAGGGSSPRPAPSSRAHTSPPPAYPVVKNVPASFNKAMANLEHSVG